MSHCVPPLGMPLTASPWPLVQAPAHWQKIDFIADLHLQAGAAATFCAWQDYMQTTRADAVFILGDLFEVWIGDDVINDGGAGVAAGSEPTPGFEARCVQILRATSRRLDIFLMHGNRDFLLGDVFAKACGLTLLEDPCVLDFANQRWLLSHGDALCLADPDYLQFRSQVRSSQWQQEFLKQPLIERQRIAQTLRRQSEMHKRKIVCDGLAVADLDTQASCAWLRQAQASTLLHGHTHKPADHNLAPGLRRLVLSDWDACATPPRAEVLRLNAPSSNQAGESCIQRIAANQAS